MVEYDYELFTGYKLQHRSLCPLGVVSGFVVEKLPEKLKRIREEKLDVAELVEYVEKLVGPIVKVTDFEHGQARDRALLDLLFIESGIVHSGGTPGPLLTAFVNKLAVKASRVPGLTYEDLIFINPRNEDVRLFMCGDESYTERDFYEGHWRIERILGQSIALCQEVFAEPESSRNSEKIFAATEGVERVGEYTQQIGMDMPREHFTVLRQYFMTHPLRGLKGPSGAFSARVPILETLIAGDCLPEQYYRYYFKENFSYLPRADLVMLQKVFNDAKGGKTLRHFLRDHPDEKMQAAVESLSASLRKFRGIHYKAVKHQIPEAISGEVHGSTGESNVGKFLRDRMRTSEGSAS